MNEQLSIAVCDDDEIVCEATCAKVSKYFEECGIRAHCDSYVSAVSLYNNLKDSDKRYDLMFLDIDMPKLGGVDLAKTLRKGNNQVDIIFVSNREDKVFETFSVRPFGFVRKNNFNADLKDTLRSYINERIHNNNYIGLQTDNNSVVHKVKVSDIVYIESFRYMQTVYLVNGEHIEVRMTMRELENMLADYDVVRVHQGYIVNLKYVQRIERSGLLLNYNGGIEINISRDKVQELKTIYLEYLRKTGDVLFDN